MTGSTRSSHDLDPRRRRALFRAWRRGMREMDLILGGFADAHIGDLGDHDLADFEALMDVADDELFAWIAGREPPEIEILLARVPINRRFPREAPYQGP